MNVILHIVFFISSLRVSYGVIYHLNASELKRMPPIYKHDDYDSCLQKPTDMYCTMHFNLVSDAPNELLHMIQEYSEHSKKHFNHTRLRYGVCVSQSCQLYIHDNTLVSETTLERCLNQSLWEKYQLKARIQRYTCYNLSNNEITIDNSDLLAGSILFAVIMLCIVGSFYDMYCTSNKHESNKDIYFLQLFSLQRNWKKLTSTKLSSEPRFQNFRCLNGMKCIGQFVVIAIHSNYIFFILSKNIHDIELVMYESSYV